MYTKYLTLHPKLYVRSSKCAVNYLEKWRRFYRTTEGTGIIVTLSPGTEYTGITLLWKMVTAKSTDEVASPVCHSTHYCFEPVFRHLFSFCSLLAFIQDSSPETMWVWKGREGIGRNVHFPLASLGFC